MVRIGVRACSGSAKSGLGFGQTVLVQERREIAIAEAFIDQRAELVFRDVEPWPRDRQFRGLVRDRASRFPSRRRGACGWRCPWGRFLVRSGPVHALAQTRKYSARIVRNHHVPNMITGKANRGTAGRKPSWIASVSGLQRVDDLAHNNQGRGDRSCDRVPEPCPSTGFDQIVLPARYGFPEQV